MGRVGELEEKCHQQHADTEAYKHNFFVKSIRIYFLVKRIFIRAITKARHKRENILQIQRIFTLHLSPRR